MDKSFLGSPSARQWRRLGVERRSGVTTPLFSIHSKKSIGHGEIPDLRLLVDWCRQVGMSLIQLLPLNEVGFNFRPYDAESSFALDPMYLSLEELSFVRPGSFEKEIQVLRKRFKPKFPFFDTGVKQAKLDLLKKIFLERSPRGEKAFEKYRKENRFWLEDHARFRVLKRRFEARAWEEWPEEFRSRDPRTLERFDRDEAEALCFERWLQWQLCLQLCEIKRDAAKKRVFLVGDLPFLVSRDSADVWAHPDYFKLDRNAGAPPDLYFSEGQEWGMPPYAWERIASHGYDYLKEKLHYAENFYDLFRIDHFVGVFRIWTFPRNVSGPHERRRQAAFDPAEESLWEEHGRRIVSVMIEHSRMLPCAEDLGTIPLCSYQVLKEYAIPGMEVQRWAKDWGASYDFKTPDSYRKNSIAVISTHDMAPFEGWWRREADTVDEGLFSQKCQSHGIDFKSVRESLFESSPVLGPGRLRWKAQISSPQILAGHLGREEKEIRDLLELYLSSYGERQKFWQAAGLKGPYEDQVSERLVEAALRFAHRAASIFSIQLLEDWLALSARSKKPILDHRLNVPGIVDETHWRLLAPVTLEEMRTLPFNGTIRKLNQETGRVNR